MPTIRPQPRPTPTLPSSDRTVRRNGATIATFRAQRSDRGVGPAVPVPSRRGRPDPILAAVAATLNHC